LLKDKPQLLIQKNAAPPAFIWPVQPKAGFNDYGYFTVQNLVDHNSAFPNQLLDYNCGSRTYDWTGGNHAGTDIILWPYPWRRMDEEIMEIRAAADGNIVIKKDGFFDRMCVNNGNPYWNGIVLQHSDGSRSIYMHFKNGGITAKGVGDAVTAGEFLGLAGSSGSSNIPHLHFEVSSPTFTTMDPYQGPCNSMNPNSLWQSQHPYNVPTVNRICSKFHTYDYYSCPNPEFTFERDTFGIGDTLVLWLYVRDLVQNSVFQLQLFNPSNQLANSWSFTVPWATMPTSYLSWNWVVDAWWVQGWWKFKATWSGNSYEHLFYMTGQPSGLADNVKPSFRLFPNPANASTTLSGITLFAGDNISITNSLGQLCRNYRIESESVSQELNLEGLKTGLYTICISGKAGNLYKQVSIIE
jgi:murein DD-endopeptidase MepM/ murein hydrolase activator NlpD